MYRTAGITLGVLLLLLGPTFSFGLHEPPAVMKPNEDLGLLIIAPTAFISAIAPLVEHKSNRGVSAIVQTTEDIYATYQGYDQPEQIKYCIKDVLESYGISFVLLVGGAEQIPGRYTSVFYEDVHQSEWIFLSDLYYADIYDEQGHFASWDSNNNGVFAEYQWEGNTDAMDLRPDVYLGRLACINAAEVTICINKIIAYESEQVYQEDWYNNIIYIGGDSLPGDQEAVDEGEYVNQKVMEIMQGFNPVKIWASLGGLDDPSYISQAINNGASFVFFNGHGHTNIWATHPHESAIWLPPGSYTNTHLRNLNNAEKLGIIISDACYHCAYDRQEDCFGWTFVVNPNGGGIAFIGGTDIDMSYGGEAIITKGIEKLCLEIATHYMQGAGTLGELWGRSIESYRTDDMDEIDIITLLENQLFGDPSLALVGLSRAPVQPNPPQGPVTGNIRMDHTYTAVTTDPDDDSVFYLFDWDDGSDSGWLGPYQSGILCNVSHQWSSIGQYDIRVKAKDAHGVQSEWSDPLPISMPLLHQTLLEVIVKWILQLLGIPIY